MFDFTGWEWTLIISNLFFMIASWSYRFENKQLIKQLNYPQIMAQTKRVLSKNGVTHIYTEHKD